VRLIIAGGREFEGLREHVAYLNDFHEQYRVREVLCGEARGADDFGKRWAESKGIPVASFPADWGRGRAAGPIRNQQMADNADALVAFPGGRGTENMILVAVRRGLFIHVWPRDAAVIL
jgi:hypothetical protein